MTKLSKTQAGAVRFFESDLEVIAGAGSGKTTVLIERFFHAMTEKGVAPDRVLAITFTEKAANEMKSRLVRECESRGLESERRQLEDAYIGTIHSFCARVLRENPIECGVDPSFQVLSDAEAEVLKNAVLDRLFQQEAASGRWMGLLLRYGERTLRANLADFYEMSRAFGQDKNLWRAGADASKEFLRVCGLFRESYDAEKKARAAYDFSDLETLTHNVFSDASPVRQAVRRRYVERFEYVLLDESQDTSPVQARIVQLLKKEGNLFLVGDPRQSIYGFRHAKPGLFKAPARISLSENYRSRPGILNFVNRFFEFEPLEARRKAGQPQRPEVEVLCAEKSRIEEARMLASRIQELVQVSREFSYGDIAVLLRSTTSVSIYEKELSDAGVPFDSVRSRGFYEKPEIKDLLNALKLVEGFDDDIALAGVLRSPFVALSDDALLWLAMNAKAGDRARPLGTALRNFSGIPELEPEDRARLENFQKLFTELQRQKNRLTIPQILDRLVAETFYDAKLLAHADGRQRFANLLKFREIARSLDSRHVLGVGEFVRACQALAERESLEPEAKAQRGEPGSVLVSTIHAAKGLEFGCVIVANLGARAHAPARPPFLASPESGLVGKDEEAYERLSKTLAAEEAGEEKRLLYVAMTRAKERLILSGRKSAAMSRILESVGGSPRSTAAPRQSSPSFQEAPFDPSMAAAIRERLRPVLKDYTRVQDMTVSELLAGSPGEPFLEPDETEEIGDAEAMPRNEFGTLFHKMMELAVRHRQFSCRSSFGRALTRHLSPGEKKEIERGFAAFWNSRWGRLVRVARRVYPELPFIYNTPFGLLKGQIDLVFETSKGQWVILDYKTGRRDESQRTQLHLYALVFKELYGEAPAKALLYFSADGSFEEIVYSEGEFADSQGMLQRYFAAAVKA